MKFETTHSNGLGVTSVSYDCDTLVEAVEAAVTDYYDITEGTEFDTITIHVEGCYICGMIIAPFNQL